MSEYSWTYVKEKALPQAMRDAKCAEMTTSLSQRWYLRISYEEWYEDMVKVLSKQFDVETVKKEATKAKYNKLRSQTLKDIATLEKIKAGKASFRELSTDARDSAQFRFYVDVLPRLKSMGIFGRLRGCTVDRCLPRLTAALTTGNALPV